MAHGLLKLQFVMWYSRMTLRVKRQLDEDHGRCYVAGWTRNDSQFARHLPQKGLLKIMRQALPGSKVLSDLVILPRFQHLYR